MCDAYTGGAPAGSPAFRAAAWTASEDVARVGTGGADRRAGAPAAPHDVRICESDRARAKGPEQWKRALRGRQRRFTDVQQALTDGRTIDPVDPSLILPQSRPMTAPARASTRCARLTRTRCNRWTAGRAEAVEALRLAGVPILVRITSRSRSSADHRGSIASGCTRKQHSTVAAGCAPPVPSSSAGQVTGPPISSRLTCPAQLARRADQHPYTPSLDDKGLPMVPPGGSSSGSAVAVAGLCAAAIGTGTSGSLLNPAAQNGSSRSSRP